ncbi:MAG: sensor histidine kinase [Pseudorhodobacter sp.]|nr:sensor histidine kinase [Frankiaceae bacterium]
MLRAQVELALRRPRSSTEHEQTLRQVALDTGRLISLAEQLLDLEQAAGSSTVLPPTTLRAALDAAQTRGRARLADATRSLEVLADVAGETAVAGTVEQALLNLVDNAVLHGSGRVAVRTRLLHGTLLLEVSDEGTSLEPAFLPHAVDRFRRADPARSAPGSGLGLALVHALVVRSGGELRLCTGAVPHRYPPLLQGLPGCAHPEVGVTATLAVPTISPARGLSFSPASGIACEHLHVSPRDPSSAGP